MRIYVAYLLAALLSFYLVMLYYGVSAGFASPVPVLALVGTLVLSAMAAPVLVYSARVGLWLGALGCGLLLPYSVMFLGGVLTDGMALALVDAPGATACRTRLGQQLLHGAGVTNAPCCRARLPRASVVQAGLGPPAPTAVGKLPRLHSLGFRLTPVANPYCLGCLPSVFPRLVGLRKG